MVAHGQILSGPQTKKHKAFYDKLNEVFLSFYFIFKIPYAFLIFVVSMCSKLHTVIFLENILIIFGYKKKENCCFRVKLYLADILKTICDLS